MAVLELDYACATHKRCVARQGRWLVRNACQTPQLRLSQSPCIGPDWPSGPTWL